MFLILSFIPSVFFSVLIRRFKSYKFEPFIFDVVRYSGFTENNFTVYGENHYVRFYPPFEFYSFQSDNHFVLGAWNEFETGKAVCRNHLADIRHLI